MARRLLPFGLLALQAGCTDATPSDTRAFVNWAASRAIELEGPEAPLPDAAAEALQTAVGSARVVGLGESRHDTREQLLLKAALVRSLIERLDFRALILEESFAHAAALDHYVRSGEGDPRALLNGLAGWSLWDSEEMLQFLEWIRGINQGRDSDQHVRVFGMDVTAPAAGVREVLDRLTAVGVPARVDADALGLDLQEGDHWPTTWGNYSALTEEQRRGLARSYDELIRSLEAARSQIVASSSLFDYQRLRWLVQVGSWGNALFSSASREQGGAIRESGMMQTVLWILEHEVPGQRALVWAHNLHVAKAPFRMPKLAEGRLEPMGVGLHAALAHDYVALGASFGSGAYEADGLREARRFPVLEPDIVDGALASVGPSTFLLDLRDARDAPTVDAWLRQERAWRAQDAQAVLVPAAAFDLVYFVQSISRSRATPAARQRFQSLGRGHD